MNTPIYADLDQIVFDGRSKEYGAYQMRQRYNRVLTRATLIACLLFISVTGLPKMIKWVMPAAPVVEKLAEPEIVGIPDVEVPEKPKEEVEVPEQPAPPKIDIETRAYMVPTPTPDELVADSMTIADVEDLDTAAISLVDNHGNGDDPFANIDPVKPCPTCPAGGTGNDVVFEEPEVKPTDFILLEKEPQAVNLDELKKLIGYPPLAKEGEIQGKVVLRVMVDKNGDYVKHIVLDSPHPILTRAVESKIDQLKMTPGIQAGKPIKVWVTLPFKFTLMN
jgi:periplasmic protein TonB